MAWPNFHLTDGRRGRLTGGSTGCKRERPTCTERKTAHRECGWKDGDSGDSAGESLCPTKKQQNPLDSDWPSHGRPFHSLGTDPQRSLSDYLAKKNRMSAIPSAKAKPYPNVSTGVTFFPRLRMTAPTDVSTSPAMIGLINKLTP